MVLLSLNVNDRDIEVEELDPTGPEVELALEVTTTDDEVKPGADVVNVND